LTTPSAVSVFASRLAFLSEFRDYLLFTAQGAKELAAGKVVGLLTSGIAPVGIWAVLLLESVALSEGGLLLAFPWMPDRAELTAPRYGYPLLLQ
jgi:nuclear pore complex protein Nup85